MFLRPIVTFPLTWTWSIGNGPVVQGLSFVELVESNKTRSPTLYLWWWCFGLACFVARLIMACRCSFMVSKSAGTGTLSNMSQWNARPQGENWCVVGAVFGYANCLTRRDSCQVYHICCLFQVLWWSCLQQHSNDIGDCLVSMSANGIALQVVDSCWLVLNAVTLKLLLNARSCKLTVIAVYTVERPRIQTEPCVFELHSPLGQLFFWKVVESLRGL